MTEPIFIKKGDSRVLLNGEPPKADCRVISEENYQSLKAGQHETIVKQRIESGKHKTIALQKDKEVDTSKLTRLTVVEKEVGRVVERKDIKINIDVQDEGRTLKIFYGEEISNDPTDLSDTDILDWLDKRTKKQCISTSPYYGQVYADDPIRKKNPPFITLHLNGEGFLYNEEGKASHKSFREAIKRAIKKDKK